MQITNREASALWIAWHGVEGNVGKEAFSHVIGLVAPITRPLLSAELNKMPVAVLFSMEGYVNHKWTAPPPEVGVWAVVVREGHLQQVTDYVNAHLSPGNRDVAYLEIGDDCLFKD